MGWRGVRGRWRGGGLRRNGEIGGWGCGEGGGEAVCWCWGAAVRGGCDVLWKLVGNLIWRLESVLE